MTPDRLQTLIERHELNQSEAARLIGVTERSVRFWLAGTYPIPVHVDRLFGLLKLTGYGARKALKMLG